MSCENRYRKANDEYATPSWIKQELFHGWFDPCPMRVCPGEDRVDGLKIDWFAYTFVNPPYSNPLPWIEKAIGENKKGKVIALLVKHDSSTRWWAKLHEAGAHFLPLMGRLHFSNCGPAPFPSVLVVLGVKESSL